MIMILLRAASADQLLLATFAILANPTCSRMSSKQWRKDHPFGFFARPKRTEQGVLDIKVWDCGIPGKDKTIWEGGLFKLQITFPDGTHMENLAYPSCGMLITNADSLLSCRISHEAT